MMPLSAKDAERLPKLLGLLGSDQPGEVVNAARAAFSLLKRNKMSWADLARQASGGYGHTGPTQASVDAAFDRGYRQGLAAGTKAMREEIDRERERERVREENKPKADPRARDAPGTARFWPPDDDIWNGADPTEIHGYEEQVDQLNELWAIETRLSDWEHGFVQSIAEQLAAKGSLSDRQCEKLDDVYDRKVKGIRR
jgi:hypothetical protein